MRALKKLNILILAALVSSPSWGQEVKVIKIGSGAPKSGEIAHLGQDNEMGAQLAVNEVNAIGDLVVGGRKIKLVLVGEDDVGDPKQGTIVAQTLVDAGVVAVVGHLNSGVSIPANVIYAANGIAQISPSSSNPDYTLRGNRTPKNNWASYRVIAHDFQQGRAVANWLGRQHAKRVALIDDSTLYGKELADYVEKGLNAKGIQVTGREAVTDKTTDFRGVLSSLKQKKPDYIFFGGMDDVASFLAKQIKQLGIKAKLVTSDGVCTNKFIELAGKAGEGMICSVGGAAVENFAQGNRFVNDYEHTFPGRRVQIYAPYAYDAVYTIVEAMKLANSTDSEEIAKALPRVHFEGLTGPIAFDRKGDVVKGAISMMQVQCGQLKTIRIER